MSKASWDVLTWVIAAVVLWILSGILDVLEEAAPYVALAVAFSVFFTGVDYIVKAIEKSRKEEE